MTDKLKPTPHATRCRCGNTLPKAATARWDAKDRLWYDCHICRPRPASPRCESGGKMGCTCDICF